MKILVISMRPKRELKLYKYSRYFVGSTQSNKLTKLFFPKLYDVTENLHSLPSDLQCHCETTGNSLPNKYSLNLKNKKTLILQSTHGSTQSIEFFNYSLIHTEGKYIKWIYCWEYLFL